MSVKACSLLLMAAALAACTGAHAGDKPALSQQQRATVTAMSKASTWGHPDLYGQFSGMQAYAHGQYQKALKYFKYGAKYADKLSALSAGLMYLNGRGTGKQPARAWAWLAIAAERGYPQFVRTRNRVWKQLDARQRRQARTIHATLEATYGDKVAKPRMRHALQYWRTQITGSHTGYNSGVKHLAVRSAGGQCAGKSVEGAPISGCGGAIYAKWRWDPKTYFAVQDSRWNARVSVGALQPLGDPSQPAPASSQAGQD